MKRIGMLYGCDLLLATEDEARAKLATKWLEHLGRRDKALAEIEIEKELKDWCAITSSSK